MSEVLERARPPRVWVPYRTEPEPEAITPAMAWSILRSTARGTIVELTMKRGVPYLLTQIPMLAFLIGYAWDVTTFANATVLTLYVAVILLPAWALYRVSRSDDPEEPVHHLGRYAAYALIPYAVYDLVRVPTCYLLDAPYWDRWYDFGSQLTGAPVGWASLVTGTLVHMVQGYVLGLGLLRVVQAPLTPERPPVSLLLPVHRVLVDVRRVHQHDAADAGLLLQRVVGPSVDGARRVGHADRSPALVAANPDSSREGCELGDCLGRLAVPVRLRLRAGIDPRPAGLSSTSACGSFGRTSPGICAVWPPGSDWR